MLFMCHQMAMQREEKIKQKELDRQQSNTDSIKQPNTPVIWVLGGPGCGKGTQCAKIVERYHFSHLSTGDLLREEVASGSDRGKELQEMMTKGLLVSNEIVLKLLGDAMVKQVGSTGFLIDGYPREPAQGAAFETMIAPVDIILYFDCTNETLVARILKRASESATVRADDNEETLKTRIATFRENTEKILQQYPNQLRRINAERDVEVIYQEVVTVIDELLKVKAVKTATA